MKRRTEYCAGLDSFRIPCPGLPGPNPPSSRQFAAAGGATSRADPRSTPKHKVVWGLLCCRPSKPRAQRPMEAADPSGWSHRCAALPDVRSDPPCLRVPAPICSAPTKQVCRNAPPSIRGNLEVPRAERVPVPPQNTKYFGDPGAAGRRSREQRERGQIRALAPLFIGASILLVIFKFRHHRMVCRRMAFGRASAQGDAFIIAAASRRPIRGFHGSQRCS